MTPPSKAKSHQINEVLKNLPQNLDAERSFLGSVILDNSVLEREILTDENFHLQFHRQIYQIMLSMWEHRIGIDPVTLADQMEKAGIDLGGNRREFIFDLEFIVPTSANANHYSGILTVETEKRRTILDGVRLIRSVDSGVLEDIYRIRQEIGTTKGNEKLDRFGWKKFRVDISDSATIKPPPQKYIVGHLPDEMGSYGLIIGPDASRKSWLGLHMGLAVACGKPVAQGVDGSFLWPAPTKGRVIYLSSEDSQNVLSRRVWSLAQLPGYEWVKSAEENLYIFPTYSTLALLTMNKDGKPVPTPEYSDLIEFATGARLIILDPLSDLLDIAESDDRAARGAVQILRDLSRRTGAGVLGIHHQNKIGMMNGEKHHQSGRGSSRFGAGCRWAVVLQPMSPQEAAAHGIEKNKDWTGIHEGKASYCDEAAGDLWIRRYVIDDRDGNILASAPAASVLPETQEEGNTTPKNENPKNEKKRGNKKGVGEPDEGGNNGIPPFYEL